MKLSNLLLIYSTIIVIGSFNFILGQRILGSGDPNPDSNALSSNSKKLLNIPLVLLLFPMTTQKMNIEPPYQKLN